MRKVEEVQAKRLEFIKTNTETILKAWGELKVKTANGLERTLPSEWKSEWVEEVLDLAGLRHSGYKTIQAAIAADKPFLEEVEKKQVTEAKTKKVAKGKAKPKKR